jgi:hypothetical protein
MTYRQAALAGPKANSLLRPPALNLSAKTVDPLRLRLARTERRPYTKSKNFLRTSLNLDRSCGTWSTKVRLPFGGIWQGIGLGAVYVFFENEAGQPRHARNAFADHRNERGKSGDAASSRK